MGKQSKSRKAECMGKGKVTPVQIAFIVDRYLSDSSYTQTRSTFRSEASNVICKSPVQEAPKSLLSLGAILDEYITLKEQKVWMDQERCRWEQEKLLVQNLLRGMQEVMNAYNAGGNSGATTPLPLPPPAVASGATVSQAELAVMTSAGQYPMYNTPPTTSTLKIYNIPTDPRNFSTPVTSHASTKRKGSKDVPDCHVMAKRAQRCIKPKDNLVTQLSNKEKNEDKSFVKCLFNSNPSVPQTPPHASSSQTDKSISPLEVCSTATSQQIMSTNCTIISSETIRVSPAQQNGVAYYSVKRNHCISTCSPVKTNLKRSNTNDHVKGRLDFGPENKITDSISTSESDKNGDILGLDFPNLDGLGLDFNLSEFLVDLGIEGDGLNLSSQQVLDSSLGSHAG